MVYRIPRSAGKPQFSQAQMDQVDACAKAVGPLEDRATELFTGVGNCYAGVMVYDLELEFGFYGTGLDYQYIGCGGANKQCCLVWTWDTYNCDPNMMKYSDN